MTNSNDDRQPRAAVLADVLPDVLVVQSHRSAAPSPWLGACMASVRDWAAGCGYGYRFIDDALFARLPADLRAKLLAGKHPLVVATDLARLYWLRELLAEGAGAVVWLDADTLVLTPEQFQLPPESFAVGREIWVQRDAKTGRWRSYQKVHNAFLMVRAGNPFLPYYLHAAEQVVRLHQGVRMVPQLIGPKLLTALHNVVQCPVAECAGMLSPAVVSDCLAGGGPALSLFLRQSRVRPAAVNLCGSSVVSGQLSPQQMLAAVNTLLRQGLAVSPA